MLGLGLAARDGGEIVAHSHDLHGFVEEIAEAGNDRRCESDRALLVFDMGRRGVRDVPVGVSVDPDVESMPLDELHHRAGGVQRKSALLDDGQVWVDEHPAVERGQRRREPERINQHAQAPWGAAAREGDLDARLPKLSHRPGRAF